MNREGDEGIEELNRQDAKNAEVQEGGVRIEPRRRDGTGKGLNRPDAKVAEREDESVVRIEPVRELDDLAHEVIGACIEVHRYLGPGFLEAIYEEALAIEFRLRGIAFERQRLIAVDYKNAVVGEGRLDFLVDGRLIVEFKAVESLSPIHKAQMISYLRTTRFHLGLLVNFNVPVLNHGLQRVILS